MYRLGHAELQLPGEKKKINPKDGVGSFLEKSGTVWLQGQVYPGPQ